MLLRGMTDALAYDRIGDVNRLSMRLKST
jgi:hypothetical protein